MSRLLGSGTIWLAVLCSMVLGVNTRIVLSGMLLLAIRRRWIQFGGSGKLVGMVRLMRGGSALGGPKVLRLAWTFTLRRALTMLFTAGVGLLGRN